MTSIPFALAEVASGFSRVIADVIMPMIVFLLLRAVVRRDLFTAIVFVVVFTVVSNPRTLLEGAVWVLVGAIMIGLLLRFGALAFAAFASGNAVLTNLPVVWPFESWYAGATILGFVLIVGPAAWGFYTSLAGRPIFQGDLIET